MSKILPDVRTIKMHGPQSILHSFWDEWKGQCLHLVDLTSRCPFKEESYAKDFWPDVFLCGVLLQSQCDSLRRLYIKHGGFFLLDVYAHQMANLQSLDLFYGEFRSHGKGYILVPVER